MDEQKGNVAFSYNTQLGFTDGTLAGTTFLTGSPRALSVLGAYNGKLYFEQYVDVATSSGPLMVSDGTKEGSKIALDRNVGSQFFYFNGTFHGNISVAIKFELLYSQTWRYLIFFVT